MKMKPTDRRLFLNTVASVVFAFMVIASAFMRTHVNVVEAQYQGNDGYYTMYWDSNANTFMCYVCPVPPPDTGGGGGTSCGDGVCQSPEEDIDNCSIDCQGVTNAGSKSNLAQSYAYDDMGYHPGSDCPDFQGTWESCPNQPVPQCNGSCANACGGSDGCGGTCGSVCTIGCPSANDPNVCSQFACQSPTSETYYNITGACGTGQSFNSGANSYQGYTLGGTVTATRSKIPPASYNYYCSQSPIYAPNGVSCYGASGISNFDPSKITPGNTENTGYYQVNETWWWDVAMIDNGWMDCDAANPYGVYPPATSYYKSISASSQYPNGICSHIFYACLKSDSGDSNYGACGNQTPNDTTFKNLVAGFSPSMVRYTGNNSYYNQQCTSGSCLGGHTAETTHVIGSHPGSANPAKIHSAPINGWIPGTGTTWYVYRELNDCPWSPDWPPLAGDPRISSYSGCDLPVTYYPYCNSATGACDPAPAPSGTYAYTPQFCPSGKSGVAINNVTFSRSGQTVSPVNNTPDYGFCYSAPANLTATPLACGSGQIRLDWTAISDPKHSPTRYQVKRDGVVIASNVTTNSYTDTVAAATNHSYTVSVISGVYGPESGRTGPEIVGPASSVSGTAPQICAVTSTGFTATPPSSPSCGATHLNIAFYNANADTYTIKRDGSTILTLPRASISWSTDGNGAQYYAFSDTGLSPTASYSYTLTLTNAGGSTVANAAPSYPATVQQICAPASPTSMSATAISPNRIDLSWVDNASNEGWYYILYGTTSSANSLLVDSLPANTTTYSATSLSPGTTYYFRARAGNAGGDSSSYTNTASATTPLNTPTSLTATAASKSQINLTWSDSNTNETGFTIERSTNGTSFSAVATVGANVLSFSDTGLSNNSGAGRQYWYRVKATNAVASSAYSNTGTTWTLMNNPTSLNITASTNSSCGTNKINLTWSANGATHYTVTEYGTGRVVVANTTATSATDVAGPANSAHTYVLTAIARNAGGEVNTTKTSNAATSALKCAPTPAGFTSTVPTSPVCSANWINIAFYNTDADRFVVKDGTTVIYDQPGSSITWQTDSAGKQYYAFSHTNLTLGSTHSYTLTMYLSESTGPTTVQAAPRYPETVQTQCVPPTVTLSAQSPTVPYNTATNLIWTPSGQEISSCTAGLGWSGSKSPSGGSASTGALVNTTTYSIFCTNPGGNSPTVSTTVTVSSLNAPSNLAATAMSSTRVDLSWNAPSQGNYTGYKIWRKTGASGTYSSTPIATIANSATLSYSDTTLSAGTTYYYKVSAYNGSDNSPYSNEANVTTSYNVPAAPASLTATPGACGTGVIELSWPASSGTVTSYTVTDTSAGGHSFTVPAPGLQVSDTGLEAGSSHTYRITATNPAGTSAATVTSPVTTVAPSLCTDLSFSADATSVVYQGSTTLRWSPVNATSCTASLGWSGAKSVTGGSQVVSNLASTTDFRLSCVSNGLPVEKTVTVRVVTPGTITVFSNLNAAWTISPGNITGSGSPTGVVKTVTPGLGGTTYSISAAQVSGYDTPIITSSIGKTSAMTYFGGEQRSFTINYARAFDYTLEDGGDVRIEKGGTNQFGQVTITKTLTPTSGPTRAVDLSLLESLTSGISYTISNLTCAPNCNSSITFTVTPQAQSGTYPITVSGSPLGKQTSFNLIVTDSPNMVVTCTHSPTTGDVNDNITWTVSVAQSPTRPNYSFSLSTPGGNPSTKVVNNTNNMTQTFTTSYGTTGVKSFDATVTDGLSNVAHCSTDATVNIGVTPRFEEF